MTDNESTIHEPLPVKGYLHQPQENIDLVNEFKQLEESLLRKLDKLQLAHVDHRWLAIGRTTLEQAFMAVNRSIFQPQRIELPDDLAVLVETASKAAHEGNRNLQAEYGEEISPPWDLAPEFMKESTRSGVRKIIEDSSITPEQLHAEWSKYHFENGWRYDLIKDREAKTHPCLVPYAELPEFQRRKDYSFREIVLDVMNR